MFKLWEIDRKTHQCVPLLDLVPGLYRHVLHRSRHRRQRGVCRGPPAEAGRVAAGVHELGQPQGEVHRAFGGVQADSGKRKRKEKSFSPSFDVKKV